MRRYWEDMTTEMAGALPWVEQQITVGVKFPEPFGQPVGNNRWLHIVLTRY